MGAALFVCESTSPAVKLATLELVLKRMLDFLLESIPEVKTAEPSEFFDDRFVHQVNNGRQLTPTISQLNRFRRLPMCKTVKIVMTLIILLTSAQVDAQQAIILVRHAEDLRTGGSDRPLTEAGEKRAQQLAGHLKDSGITAIYTSALQRTINTALPTAKALRIESLPQSQLGTNFKPDDLTAFVEVLRTQHKSDVVLFVGHVNTVPALIKALGHPTSIKIPETEYDNFFVLIPRGDGAPLLLRIRY